MRDICCCRFLPVPVLVFVLVFVLLPFSEDLHPAGSAISSKLPTPLASPPEFAFALSPRSSFEKLWGIQDSATTGSVCCVAIRPQGGSCSSTRASDGCSSLDPLQRWRGGSSNGGFSPPLSSRWEPSSSSSHLYNHHHHPHSHHQHQQQAELSSFTALCSSLPRRLPHFGASPFSPSGSVSHARSSSPNEPSHHPQRDITDNNSISSNSSPPGSFRAPSWTPRDTHTGDLASASSDSLSRTPDQNSSREGHVQTRTSTHSEPSGYSRKSFTTNSHRSSFQRNLSGTYSSLSKMGQRGFFRRQKSESRTSFPLEGGPLTQRAAQHVGGMDWSMQAFSQLVASSQREGFGLQDNVEAGNAAGNADEGSSSYPERIRVASLQSSHRCSPDLQGDGQMCGICSRWLLHRPPCSSQRMMVGNIDLPVVGVLVCGHVFHADCLEKVVPNVLRHDPPCPQCDQFKDPSGKGSASLGIGSLKSAHEPIKSKLAQIGPQLWRSFSSAKSSMATEPEKQKGAYISGAGFLHRSLSRKQFSFGNKSSKAASSHSWGSRKANSPAQVSPENQL